MRRSSFRPPDSGGKRHTLLEEVDEALHRQRALAQALYEGIAPDILFPGVAGGGDETVGERMRMM